MDHIQEVCSRRPPLAGGGRQLDAPEHVAPRKCCSEEFLYCSGYPTTLGAADCLILLRVSHQVLDLKLTFYLSHHIFYRIQTHKQQFNHQIPI